MKSLLFIISLAIACLTQAAAQDGVIFPKGEKATTDHQVGTIWLNELSPADSTFNYSIAMATFAPGARLHWHAHPDGQVLLYTDGVGYYQERGKPLRRVAKGEVVKCQPGVVHWHGATPSSGVTYIATAVYATSGKRPQSVCRPRPYRELSARRAGPLPQSYTSLGSNS